MMNIQTLRAKINNYNNKKILENGELYMFDSRITKTEQDNIVKNFDEIVSVESEKETSKNEALKQKIITPDMLEIDELKKIINISKITSCK